MTESAASYVNELLVQMQSFDTPTGWQRLSGALIGAANLLLPAHRQLPKPTPAPANVLLIAATNRAEALDPALIRPGRFDRRLTFERPPKTSRRALVDYFLARKAHEADLDDAERRDALAALTTGYTPAMIENLFDEALINAVRRGATAMTGPDVEHARLLIEVGLGNPVDYTDHERRLIATHESGHAVTAWLVAPHRRLEVLSIIKRRDALGLLAHGDREDVYTRSRDELLALIQIAMGGQVAEALFYGDVSTGPASDLAQATGLACQMVGAAGMSDSLVSFAAVSAGSLTDTNLVGRVLADPASREQVETLLADAHRKVTTLLTAHRPHVTALRDALLARHELLGTEITDVLEDVEAPAVVDVTDPADRGPRHRPARDHLGPPHQPAVMADERPPGRVFLAAAYLVLLVLGATLATIGAFLVPAGPRIGSFLVSYGVIVAVVTNPGVAALGARLTGTRLGAAAPLAAWLVMLWVLNSRPEGDRIPPFDLKGGIIPGRRVAGRGDHGDPRAHRARRDRARLQPARRGRTACPRQDECQRAGEGPRDGR